jgi:hypothetical protein
VSYLWLGYSLHGKTEGSKRHLITIDKPLIKSFCLTFDIRTGATHILKRLESSQTLNRMRTDNIMAKSRK